MQHLLGLLCFHVTFALVAGDFYGASRLHGLKLKEDKPTFHVDSAFYESAVEGSSHARKDVTWEVNKQIKSHGVQDITHKHTFLEAFGDIAYGEQKRLRIQKGDVVAHVYENDRGNGGSEDRAYALPQEILDAEEDSAVEVEWDADRAGEAHVTVDRAILTSPGDHIGILDVTDKVNTMIRQHGFKNFTNAQAFTSLGDERIPRNSMMRITIGNLTMELKPTKVHNYSIPEALIVEARANEDEEAMMEVTGRLGPAACRRSKQRLWEGPASQEECAERCSDTTDCMFYSVWNHWCRLTPSCQRLQVIPGREVTIFVDESKRKGCFYRCQGTDKGGLPRCHWKACTGCAVCSSTSTHEADDATVVYANMSAQLSLERAAGKVADIIKFEQDETQNISEDEADAQIEAELLVSEDFAEDLEEGEMWCSGDEDVKLTVEEVAFAKCPPGAAPMGKQNETLNFLRTSRLQAAMCAAKRMGWTTLKETGGMGYQARGYATFESAIWPKDPVCKELPDQTWAQQHANLPKYRPDDVPRWMPKYVNEQWNVEFHENWKVASNSFPEYLHCEYGNNWTKVPNREPVLPGRVVAFAVRNPIDRFVSAASELIERAVNKWCPSGPCNSSDAFDPENTLTMMHHTTTWLPLIDDAKGGFTPDKLPMLMRNMVNDASCNFATYASEHLTSQACFVTQNAGPAAPVSVVLKLEHVDLGLQKLANRVGRTMSGRCPFGHANVKSSKPFANKVPSSKIMLNYLHHEPELLKKLCMMYAQDFVCFDYALPDVCSDLF